VYDALDRSWLRSVALVCSDVLGEAAIASDHHAFYISFRYLCDGDIDGLSAELPSGRLRNVAPTSRMTALSDNMDVLRSTLQCETQRTMCPL
jgi:hypothetical protein